MSYSEPTAAFTSNFRQRTISILHVLPEHLAPWWWVSIRMV